MREQDGRTTGRKLKIGTCRMAYVARAIEHDETLALMKVIVNAETDRTPGAGILGTESGELIQILGARCSQVGLHGAERCGLYPPDP
jgi:pyruvate/2-oxoglutarate dehydrogenase complex dihydrolipoamide dehydrogenase (E3) component